MLTSHSLLQRYWHDKHFDIRHVRVWYIDRGAPDDRSRAEGPMIRLEPYYMIVRSDESEKPVPYHRILLITYRRMVAFENRKIRGLAEEILRESP
jgi:uncharacterized protein (UPF0248 family)